jgi:hypothetical protein
VPKWLYGVIIGKTEVRVTQALHADNLMHEINTVLEPAENGESTRKVLSNTALHGRPRQTLKLAHSLRMSGQDDFNASFMATLAFDFDTIYA